MNRGIGTLLACVVLLGLGAALYTFQSERAPEVQLPRAPEGVRVIVEVDNGGGVSDMARQATLHLRDLGFDVVRYGNAGRSDMDTTRVYDRTGAPGALELAQAVRAALGSGVVESAPDSTLMVDVTVLLGRDWPPRPEAAGDGGGAGESGGGRGSGEGPAEGGGR